MYKICVYIPESHLEQVKNAMFNSGAGKVGPYSCCSWQTLGEGQFLPLENSNAYLGEIDQLEKVTEYLVEMICEKTMIKQVIAAMKKAHPYEQPAYQVIKIEDF